MECEQIDRIKQLLLKYLTGEINLEEEKELQEWCDRHPANRDLLEELQGKSFFSAVVEAEQDQALFRQEWSRLKKQTVGKQSMRRMRWSVAAAVIIIMPVLVALLLPRSPNQTFFPVATETNQAMIYWADGSITRVGAPVSAPDDRRPDTIRLEAAVPDRSTEDFHRIVIPRGAEYIVGLDDGTTVHLNAESQLEIPVNYNISYRTVNLKGGAYFEVAQDMHSPFIVRVGEMKIEVLGTSFDVRAYADEGDVRTTLVHGEVNIYTASHQVRLYPGMQAVVRGNGNVSVSEVNVARYIAWLSGKFVFENERLEDILKEVGRWYDVCFRIGDAAIADMRMTMNLPRYQDWREFVAAVERIGQLRFLDEGDEVHISR